MIEPDPRKKQTESSAGSAPPHPRWKEFLEIAKKDSSFSGFLLAVKMIDSSTEKILLADTFLTHISVVQGTRSWQNALGRLAKQTPPIYEDMGKAKIHEWKDRYIEATMETEQQVELPQKPIRWNGDTKDLGFLFEALKFRFGGTRLDFLKHFVDQDGNPINGPGMASNMNNSKFKLADDIKEAIRKAPSA